MTRLKAFKTIDTDGVTSILVDAAQRIKSNPNDLTYVLHQTEIINDCITELGLRSDKQ